MAGAAERSGKQDRPSAPDLHRRDPARLRAGGAALSRAGVPLVPTKPRPVRGFVVFRWLVYALLAGDVLLYARYGRATELLDTAAWFVLLMLFEWETGGWPVPGRLRPLVHMIRGLASLGVLAAVVGYALEGVWLDFANEATWLLVVALLEFELRVPAASATARRTRGMAAAVLFAGLLGFMLLWAAMGLVGDGGERRAAALDAWDAMLWLVAFVAIELNALRLAPERG